MARSKRPSGPWGPLPGLASARGPLPRLAAACGPLPGLAAALAVGVGLACASAPPAPPPDPGLRAETVRPGGDEITVDDFRRVCEALARDLRRQSFIADAATPPVVAIRQLENKTGLPIDEAIFQETIRADLMQHAGGAVRFRDDVSYQDILRERAQNEPGKVTVTLTDSVVDTQTVDRTDRGYATGSISGSGWGGRSTRETATHVDKEARVSGAVAEVDYFLRGIVFQMRETGATGRQGSYFQYQFRLVDARTGLIAWERMLDSRPGDAYAKVLPPVAPAASPAAPPEPARAPAPRASPTPPPAVSPPRTAAAPPPAPAPTSPAAGRALPGPSSPYAAVAPAAPPGLPEGAALADLDFGRFHALVIGNERYRALPELGAAGADARAVAEALERDYRFEVTLLLDASRREIVSALADYRGELGPGDNLLIYYAGHGWFDEDARQGYWLPVEALEDDPSDWISNATINDMLRANDANHILVVADSCYSGTLTRGLAVRPLGSRVWERLAVRRSRTALTSGGLEPVEDDGGSGHSVFASAFLEALAENRGVLDGQGLFARIRRPVMVNADQTPEYGDIRKAGHDGGDFLFVRR